MPKKQATPKKAPRAQRIASRTTKLSIGGLFLAGRVLKNVSTGVAKGVAEVAAEVKEGYDNARDELRDK